MVFNTFLESRQKVHGRHYVPDKRRAAHRFLSLPGAAALQTLVQAISLHRLANGSSKRCFEGRNRLAAGNNKCVHTHLGVSSTYCPRPKEVFLLQGTRSEHPRSPGSGRPLSGAALEGAAPAPPPAQPGAGLSPLRTFLSCSFHIAPFSGSEDFLVDSDNRLGVP